MRDESISVVCFYWDTGSREYLPEHVNALAKSVHEHLSVPHRFICVYDVEDTSGFDRDIVELIPLPESAKWIAALVNPTKPTLPSSYRRLWAFSKEAKCLGDRILQLDIDCLIVGDLLPIFEYSDADFVGWRPNSEFIKTHHSRSDGLKRIGGGTWLLRTGTLTRIWDNFTINGMMKAKNAGWRGSDQAWLSYHFAKNGIVFPRNMGIYHTQDTRLWKDQAPTDARIIHFNGNIKSWERDAHAVKWYCNLVGIEYDPTINTKKVRRMKRARKRWERTIGSSSVTFVAFWWGAWPDKKNAKLGPAYVKRLFDSISRFVPKDFDHRFVLFTDQPKMDFGRNDIKIRKLNVPEDLRWNLKKMYMYSEEAKLSGTVICFDLDVVIVGSLVPLINQVNRMESKLLLTCQGAYRRKRSRGVGGSVVGFTPSPILAEKLWKPVLEKQPEIERVTRGSERRYYKKWLTASEIGFWERYIPGRILSYKVDYKKRLIDKTSVIRFHGRPRPHEVEDMLIKKYWR